MRAFLRTVTMRPLPISNSLVNAEPHNVWNTAYVEVDQSVRNIVAIIQAHLLFHNQYP